MADTKVATADEALAKMVSIVEALPEGQRQGAMFKANALINEASNIKALPDNVRKEIAAEWMAKEDSNAELRKSVAEAVGLIEDEQGEGEPSAAGGDAGEEDDQGEASEEEIEAYLDSLSEEELEQLVGEIEASEGEDLPDEFYEVIADLSDEELGLVERYMAEAEKLDQAAEGQSMTKADAMADAWLDRGDEDLKKFIGAARGAMQSAGAFSRAMAGRVGNAMRSGSVAGSVRGGRFGARAGAAAGGLAGRAKGAFLSRKIGATGAAAAAVGAEFRRRGAEAGAAMGRRFGSTAGRYGGQAAIGTGVLGGGGALYASRRKG
jgi:hypothetical protein